MGGYPTHPAISNHIVSQALKRQPHHTKKKYGACMHPPVEEFCMRGAGTHTQLIQPWRTNVVSRLLKGLSHKHAKKRFVNRVLKGQPSR